MKRLVPILILAFGLTALAESQQTSSPTVKLKVGTLPYISNAVLQIAQEEGYFREQGLEVTLVPFRTNNDLIPLVLKGELDAAPPALTPAIFNAVLGGGRLQFVLPLTLATGKLGTITAFMARRADVASGRFGIAASWKGAKIALPSSTRESVTSFALWRQLQTMGLTLKDVVLVPVDAAVQADALAAGQLDLALVPEPWITRMLDRGDLEVVMPAEPLTPGIVYSGIVYGARLLSDREAGIRFAMAFLKASRQYLLGKTPRNVEIVVGMTGLSETLVRKMGWADTSPDGVIEPKSILEYEGWLVDQGSLERVVQPREFLDPSFAEAAVRRLGGEKR
jgi:NitT/TauT family transport system substrate-binding protein